MGFQGLQAGRASQVGQGEVPKAVLVSGWWVMDVWRMEVWRVW